MADSGDISKLASILHENGYKVLSGLSKLSLNAVLLQKINIQFEKFLECDQDKDTNKFHVLSSSSNSEMIQELHFLYDFMQKTLALKLTNNTNLPLLKNKVDLTKFKSIKYLEIKKVPVKEITGLKLIQSYVETIVCITCISKLEELLAECGGDNSSGFVWSELSEAIIKYNNIRVVDTSIAFAPWLQVLDLSHNQIVDVKAIECLPNLKLVDLSFNYLSAVPTFNKSARKKIKVLMLNNNCIEDLSGLEGLTYLVYLGLSSNWISNYDSLKPLLKLPNLESLSIKSNPISIPKDYRQKVVVYLYMGASWNDFSLDGSRLSKYEKLIAGYKVCETVSSSGSTPTEPVINNSPVMQTSTESAKSSGKNKKGGKVRLAVIPNLDGTYEEIPAEISGVSFTESSSAQHLITAKQIENARRTYGPDNWLRADVGSTVHSLLGLPPSEALSSTPFDDICLEAALKSDDNIVTTKAIVENNPETSGGSDGCDKHESFETCTENLPSNYFSISNLGYSTGNEEEKTGVEGGSPETAPDVEPKSGLREEIEDEDEKLFLATKITKNGSNAVQTEELFLVLTDTELKEKDSNEARVINKWSISSLESCCKVQANRLQLMFDTVKRDKRERVYEMEESEAQSVFKILTEILESRTLEEMNQIAYKCMSCSSQFSQMKNCRKKEANPRCPFCSSKLILEADDHSPSDRSQLKSVEKNVSASKESNVRVFQNESSSASAIDGFSSQCDIVKSHSAESIGSAASLDESNDLPANQNVNFKTSDSDIEILSNPSQSSIEVIDEPPTLSDGSTSISKRSSEERQISQSDIVEPENPTQNINVGGLTESSSSGSVTDSVCTTYENSNNLNRAMNNPGNINVVIEDAAEIPKRRGCRDFDTVLEGEEESIVNKKTTRQINKNKINSTMNEVQYSYTDFTKIDHRIKLLLYSKIFEDNTEEFCFILRCSVLLANSAKCIQACVVSSNKKIYILKVIGPEEGDDASTFLQKSRSLRFNLKLLKSLNVLMWYQGFSVRLHDAHEKLMEFLILLKDKKRTQCFLKFLQSLDSYLPTGCEIVTECSQKTVLAMQHILLSGASEDSNIQYFSLLNSSSINSCSDMIDIEGGAILTNSTDLLLFPSDPTWFCDGANQPQKPGFSQKLSNLMSVKMEDTRVSLQFVIGLEEEEEIWDLTMETRDAVEELVASLKTPWEELFSVPLQVTSI